MNAPNEPLVIDIPAPAGVLYDTVSMTALGSDQLVHFLPVYGK